MAYRLPEVRRQMSDASKPVDIYIDNGTITRISLPCFYLVPEKRPNVGTRMIRVMQDHLGWPSPDRPDRSSQLHDVPPCHELPFSHMKKVPIDFTAEGYESAAVRGDYPDGFSATAVIDDNVIRIELTSECQDAQDKELDFRFNVIVRNELGDLKDIVLSGILHIMPQYLYVG